MLTAVLFVPLAVLVHKVLARQDTPYMAVATAFEVIAGVVQFLGLVRWSFLRLVVCSSMIVDRSCML